MAKHKPDYAKARLKRRVEQAAAHLSADYAKAAWEASAALTAMNSVAKN